MAKNLTARGAGIDRTLNLVAALLRGESLDRNRAADLLDVQPAAAYRQLARILAGVPGVVRRGGAIRFNPGSLSQPTSLQAAIGACLMTGLARLFQGTSYATGMKEAFEYVQSRNVRQLRFADFERKFMFSIQGGEASLPESAAALDDLINALLEQHHVRIKYLDFGGQELKLSVEPLSLVVYGHQIYFIGRSTQRGIRAYRFARVQQLTETQRSFVYPAKTEYDPAEMLDETFGMFVGTDAPFADVEILLARRWATFALTHKWHASQRTVVAKDGVHVSMHLKPCRELTAWILGFGAEATVLRPGGLRRKIATITRKMASRYR